METCWHDGRYGFGVMMAAFRPVNPRILESGPRMGSHGDGCGFILSKSEKVVIAMVPEAWRQIRLHWNCFLI